jgi:glucose-1-phosphate cytidylyltransferase|tara:strand:- start:8925 stop:9626 length:702 start_codon:yes stop_codon:yes gene_type:complete
MNNIRIAVLCGGKGVRLKPLTDMIPKVLIMLRDKPILHHSLDHYSKQGVKDFLLCVGYKGEMIKNYFKEIENDTYKLKYIESGDHVTMLKRIYDLKDYFDEDIVITYGDTITNVIFEDLLKFHKENGSSATIVTKDIISPFGLLDIQENKVKKFEEKPKFRYYIGTMVLNKKVFDHINESLLEDENGIVKFFQKLVELDYLNAYQHQGKELTFNTKAEMISAEEDIIDFLYLN